jgi:hypothetical protein
MKKSNALAKYVLLVLCLATIMLLLSTGCNSGPMSRPTISTQSRALPVSTVTPSVARCPSAVHSPHGSVPFGKEACSPDGTKYAREIEPRDQGHIGVFAAQNDEPLSEISMGEEDNDLKGLAWSPDSRWIAVMYHRGNGGYIAIVHAETGDQVKQVPIGKWYHHMQFSSDGKRIIAEGDPLDVGSLEIPSMPTPMPTNVESLPSPPADKAGGTPTGAVENQLPLIVEGVFVTRRDSQLLLADRPFRFVGTNAYFLQPEMAYGNAEGVIETLDTMVMLGMPVARIWAFNDHDPDKDPAAIQVRPGEYREESLVALDRVIAEARQRNIRLILTLVNYWQDYGGLDRYIAWCDCDASQGDFYLDGKIKDMYRDYVAMLVNRKNTVTGILYREDETILAWELGNELRNPSGRPEDFLAWHEEMAAYIKSLDPNHLVADGGEGFDDAPELYPGLSSPYAVRGDEGASYHRLVDLPNIDLVSYHLYPSKWGLNDDSDVEIWIRVHEALAQQAGKVAYLGEYGIHGDDASRSVTFDRWLTTALTDNRSTGSLVWGLVYEDRPDYDGFSVYCPAQTETCTVIRGHATDLATHANR